MASITVAILPMRPDASRTQAQHPALCCRRSPRYAPSKHTDLSRPCERERDPRGLVNALGEVLRLGVSLRRCSCIMAFLPSCCTCRTLCSDTDSLRGAAPSHSTTCLKLLTDPRHSRTQERSVQPGQGRRPGSFILRPSLPSEACLFAWSCYTIAVRCAIAFLPVCNSLSPLTLPNSSHSPVPERERH